MYTQVKINRNGKIAEFYTGDGYNNGGRTRRYRNVTQSSLERLFRILKFEYIKTPNTEFYVSNVVEF